MNAEKIHVETLENVLIKDLVINASAKQDLQDKIVKMVSGLSFCFLFHFILGGCQFNKCCFQGSSCKVTVD